MTETLGGEPAVPHESADIWAVQADGAGTQVVEAAVEDGTWVTVVMPGDGTPGVEATFDVGAIVPLLGGAALFGIVLGLFLAGSGAMVVLRSTRYRSAG